VSGLLERRIWCIALGALKARQFLLLGGVQISMHALLSKLQACAAILKNGTRLQQLLQSYPLLGQAERSGFLGVDSIQICTGGGIG